MCGHGLANSDLILGEAWQKAGCEEGEIQADSLWIRATFLFLSGLYLWPVWRAENWNGRKLWEFGSLSEKNATTKI